jgi:hypothetical protein
MHGIVSLLPEPFYTQVSTIWDELSERHGLNGVRVTPFPHFSWQIAQEYPSPALEEALQMVASAAAPLRISTAGIGLFTGPAPVLYIPIIKTSALVTLHARIWERFSSCGRGISAYYHPTGWMPHISLAYIDLTPANVGGIVKDLVFRDFTWDMLIDNIAYIHEPNGEVGQLRLRYELVGKGLR